VTTLNSQENSWVGRKHRGVAAGRIAPTSGLKR